MAKEQEKRAYEVYLEAMDGLDALGRLVEESNDPRLQIQRKGKSNLKKHILDPERLGALPEDLRPTDPETLTSQQINDITNALQGRYTDDAANTLHTNLDNIVDNQVPEKTLDELIRVKDIREKVPEKDTALLQSYDRYKGIADLVRRYTDGKQLAEQERKIILQAAESGAANATTKNLENYSEETQAKWQKVAIGMVHQKFASGEDVKGYVLPGLEIEREKAQKAYEQLAEKRQKTVHDITRYAYKALAKGDKKDFEKALGMLYSAERGKLEKAE